jgi:hypothetical protein
VRARLWLLRIKLHGGAAKRQSSAEEQERRECTHRSGALRRAAARQRRSAPQPSRPHADGVLLRRKQGKNGVGVTERDGALRV